MWRKVERFDAVYCPTYDESWGAIGETHASYVHGVGHSGPVVEVTIDAAGGTASGNPGPSSRSLSMPRAAPAGRCVVCAVAR